MASTFKRVAKASVTASQNAGSADAIYTVPAGASSTALNSIIIGISLCNKTSSDITAGVYLSNYDGTNNAYIAKGVTVPANTTLEIMQGNKLVVMNSGSAGDVIRVETNTSTSLDVVLSVLENV